MYSAAENVATKGSYNLFAQNARFQFNQGGIAPAWNEETTAIVNFKHGKLTVCDSQRVAERVARKRETPITGDRRRPLNLAQSLQQSGAVRWQSNLGESNKFEATSLVVCSNAVVSALKYQVRFRSQPQWFLVAFDTQKGKPIFRHELRAEPLPGGLLVDRHGRYVLNMLDGSMMAFGTSRE